MSESFAFEPDLAQAGTIPASWYRDPALLVREQSQIFRRTWQFVGRTHELREVGDFITCTVADEPIVVAHAEAGLRAFSGVCRHRAGPVAAGAGRRKSLQCGYHGWTYGLDGQLLATPEFEGVRGFDKSSVCLPPVRVATWGPFAFVNLDVAAPPLLQMLGEIPSETEPLRLERLRSYKRVDYEIACNWKVYVDNYLEGYHIPIVHPGLFQQLDYTAYRVETRALHSKQHAPIRARTRDSLYRRNLPPGADPIALYYWVFPNLMLNIYPDNLQTNLIVPLGPERTLTRFEWFVADPERPTLATEFAESFAFSDAVQQEDIAICQAVQRGLASRHYHSGRYSVSRENGVHHFHGLLGAYLGQP